VVSKEVPDLKVRAEREIVKLLDYYFSLGEGMTEAFFEKIQPSLSSPDM